MRAGAAKTTLTKHKSGLLWRAGTVHRMWQTVMSMLRWRDRR